MKKLVFLVSLCAWFGSATAGTDSVYVQLIGDTVKVWNVDAYENCCISVVVDVTVSNDSIIVIEHDTATSYCHCMCTFDFSTSLTGLTAGRYLVLVYRQYTVLTPDSLYFIDSTSFSYGGSASGNLKFVGYQSPCNNPVSVEDEQDRYPLHTALCQNYPNPFNPSTVIRYSLPVNGWVTLKVYDMLGREVATLVEEMKQPGEYSVRWETNNFPSGVYFYRLTAGIFLDTKKLIITK